MAETNDNQNAYRLRELSEGLDKLAELVRELSPDSLAPVSAISAVWAEAPIILRLKFVRDVLPERSELQPQLRQASALEELRQRGSELETWVERYPSLFADAIMLLKNDSVCNDRLLKDHGEQAVILAMSTLMEARETLDRELVTYGIEYIQVSPGETIGSEYEVIGEEALTYVKGTVARVLRIGFCKDGILTLPTQVMRSSGPANTQYPISNTVPILAPSPNLSHDARSFDPPASPATRRGGNPGRGTGWPNTECEAQTPNTQYPIPITLSDPEWLRILIQRTHGCELAAVSEIVRWLQELVDVANSYSPLDAGAAAGSNLSQLLGSIAPLLSMRYADGLNGIDEVWGKPLLEARDPILEWLKETLSIDPISPNRGDKYNPLLMEEVETRRTVHANEIETVARIERIGLMRDGLPVIKAEVVRYVAGRE